MKLAFVFAPPPRPVLPANEHSRKRFNSRNREYLAYGSIIVLALLDVTGKILALRNSLPALHTPLLNIAYFANPGIAFSIPLPQTLILFITGGLIIAFASFFISVKNHNIKIALTSALLGATSNFFDRLLTGFTTDYIILFSRSAINIADLLILAGISYCAWYYQKADTTRRLS